MNPKIDPKTLSNLGINLDDKQQAALLEHLQQTLEERVGLAVFDLLSDDEAKELLKLSEAGDDKATRDWVAAHVPDIGEVVQDEYDILLGELAQNAKNM